jgi:hypothetical protein
MVFIWRGFGLMVPIVFGICAWIVSFWYEDTRLGNASFMGWSMFYTAIVLLLPGLAMWGGTTDEDGTVRKHDFMFVPILFWSLGLGGLCTYVLLQRDPSPSEDEDAAPVVQTTEDKEPEAEKVYRTVNFLNSSEDTLDCIIKTAGGSETVTVNPHSWQPMDLLIDKYSFEVSDRKGKVLATYSADKFEEPSSSKVDYESGWVQLDNGGHKLVLVDVTVMMPADYTTKDLAKTDWTKQVVEVYDGKSFMEPQVPKEAKYNSRVLEPGDLLPSKVGTDEKVYALVTVPADEELTNKYFIERFKEIYFK